MAVHRFSFFLLICCVAGVFFTGCGKKSMLVPPQDVAPAVVSDVHYKIDEAGVTFSWGNPRFLENGEPLTEVSRFDVQVAEISVEKFCEGCPVLYGKEITVQGSRVIEQKSEYRLQKMKPGYHYFFRVRGRTSHWTAGRYSDAVSLVWE